MIQPITAGTSLIRPAVSPASPPKYARDVAVSFSSKARRLVSAHAPAYMPADAMPKKSGNSRIDPLLAGGDYWWHNNSGTVTSTSDGLSTSEHTLTYSFMTASSVKGFKALGSSEKTAVVAALNYLASIVDVTFAPAASGAAGDIQYGKSTQNGKSSGYAYYPNSGSVGGNVYLANEYFKDTTDLSAGTYAWEVMLHETGHALGLKHPGNYNAGGGGTPGPYLPASLDNRLYTVMSYHNPANARQVTATVNGSRFSLRWDYVNPDYMQLLDLQALQYLYGPSTNAHIASASDGSTQLDNPGAQATNYSWEDNGKFLATIWNTNSGSSIDASNQTGKNIIDLRSGHFSSIGIRNPYADLPDNLKNATLYARNASGAAKPTYTGKKNVAIALGSHIDTAIGGNAGNKIIGNNDTSNTLSGGSGDDKFFIGKANTTVTGGGGTDKVFLHKISKTTKWTVVNNHDGTYTATATDSATNQVVNTSTLSGGISKIFKWNGIKTVPIGKNLLA